MKQPLATGGLCYGARRWGQLNDLVVYVSDFDPLSMPCTCEKGVSLAIWVIINSAHSLCRRGAALTEFKPMIDLGLSNLGRHELGARGRLED